MPRKPRRAALPSSDLNSRGCGKAAPASLMLALLALTSCPHQAHTRVSDVAPAKAVRTTLHALLSRVTPTRWGQANSAPVQARISAVNVSSHHLEGLVDGELNSANTVRDNGASVPGNVPNETVAGNDAPSESSTSNRGLNDVIAGDHASRQTTLGNDAPSETVAGNDAPSDDPLSVPTVLHRELQANEAEREIPLVYSIGRETWIFAEPRFSAKQLGYLRFGARTQRSEAVASRRGCSAGWYAIKPTGYVCANGRTATIDSNHPLVKASIERPNRTAALPFLYTKATRGIPRYFGYAPSDAERPRVFSKRLVSQLGQAQISTLPVWWRQPRQVFGYQRPEDRAALSDGLAGSGVALLGLYSDHGTLYGVTPDLELVTTDGLEAVRPSTFAGIQLLGAETLPVAFAMSETVWLYQSHPSAAPRPTRRLLRREAVAMSEERVEVQGQQWWRTKAGDWLRSSGVRAIQRRSEFPDWARDGQIWVDVSINQQTLVAYEGQRAVYATLVSTGVDGLLDPATSKSTKTGVFHIVSKHLTATMNSDAPEDAYEMREVPWVQYFSAGYALHGAYWHDAFGQPRSHGCINLSPLDARWLFHFTHPGLPQDWHGTIPSEPSATVFVHA